MVELNPREVTVIGAAGHIGLGSSLALTDAGYRVHGVDINEAHNRLIMAGQTPFLEEGADALLAKALARGLLRMTADLQSVPASKYIIVLVGTPVDEHLNPALDALDGVMMSLAPRIRPGHVIILRSTVSPGTTDHLRRELERATGLVVGRDFTLAYAPERTAQGQVIKEIATLPQLVGVYADDDYDQVSAFFSSFSAGESIMLTPVEAEIGKLITNMTRYVSFALSNEFYLIGNHYNVNINKVIDASNCGYPRLDLPIPGPNVGGPCLYKDGWFLIERIPFQDLVSTAFRINESMPMQIIQQLEKFEGIGKVGILGMTFKANSDDIRNSLSFKLRNQLKFLGYECVAVEPNLAGYAAVAELRGCDAVVLMTPHRQFKDFAHILQAVDNVRCIYVDIWGFWDEIRYLSRNGIWQGGAV